MSTPDLQSIHHWREWTYVTSNDTLLTSWAPSKYSAASAIGVHPYTAIMIAAFGTNAENEEALVQISGFMDESDRGGVGPGSMLWRGGVILGANSAAEQPLAGGEWPASTTYFEADTISTGVAGAGGSEMATGIVVSNSNNQAMMILPTLGYTHLMALISLSGTTGATSASMGLVWRPVSTDSVI